MVTDTNSADVISQNGQTLFVPDMEEAISEFLNGLSLHPPLGSIRTLQMPHLMGLSVRIERLRKEGKIW